MPMDVDYVTAKAALEELDEILSSIPHGKRKMIADDYLDFLDAMIMKYRKTKAEKRQEKIEQIISDFVST